jgi:Helicase associated domain
LPPDWQEHRNHIRSPSSAAFFSGLLKHFCDREGHCRVPQNYNAADGYRLGQWVRVQRANKKRICLDRRQRLEGLPGWEWEVVAPKLPGPKDSGDPS